MTSKIILRANELTNHSEWGFYVDLFYEHIRPVKKIQVQGKDFFYLEENKLVHTDDHLFLTLEEAKRFLLKKIKESKAISEQELIMVESYFNTRKESLEIQQQRYKKIISELKSLGCE